MLNVDGHQGEAIVRQTALASRGVCPSPFAPMQTGDGLLARLPQNGGAHSLHRFADLCAAARTFGNGIVEVTARGSLQIRGLGAASPDGFAKALIACGISGAVGPLIITNPLAGLDPAETLDAMPLVAALRPRLDELALTTPFAPKVSVVVDGGGVLHLDALSADVRLHAETTLGGIRLHVLIGGDGATAILLGAIEPAVAVETVVGLLTVIARYGNKLRARDIVRTEGTKAFRSAIADQLVLAASPPPRPAAETLGTHPLRDGNVAIGVGLAFGQVSADRLEGLVDAAARAGAVAIAPAQGRTLLAIGVASEAAPTFIADADRLGFVTRENDPRRQVIACAGAPACASAAMPARESAPTIAAAAGGLLDGSLRIHVSGCAKGCAHPGAGTLTFVGGDRGCGLIMADAARAEPIGFFAADSLPTRLARLADRIDAARRPGERSAEVLARLGVSLVSFIVLEGTAA